MTEFSIKIADRVICCHVQFASTEKYCADYVVVEPADFTVTVHQDDIAKEREYDRREKELEGLPVRAFSDSYLEPLALYRKIADRLVEFDTLLFHGSVVAVDGQSFLFTAKSGTGKSTHTRLWRKLFGERAVMVNDDKPLLKIDTNGVQVCGTPWDGKHKPSTNCMLPLKAICILERGEENQICQISASEALPMLMQQCHRPSNVLKYMDLLDKLTNIMAFYRLQCNMDEEAARISYEAMR